MSMCRVNRINVWKRNEWIRMSSMSVIYVQCGWIMHIGVLVCYMIFMHENDIVWIVWCMKYDKECYGVFGTRTRKVMTMHIEWWIIPAWHNLWHDIRYDELIHVLWYDYYGVWCGCICVCHVVRKMNGVITNGAQDAMICM